MVGYKSGESNTANWNTMIGYLAGNTSSTGGSQVLVGYQAGQNNTGGWNTIVGSVAGTSSGAGSFNTFLGLASGEQATGSNNLFLGRWAGRFEGANSNRLVIETSYDGTDYFNNALMYGHFTDKYLRVNGRLQQNVNRDFDWGGSFTNTGGTWSRYGLKVQAGTNDGSSTNYMIDFYNGGGGWEGAIELINGTLSLVNTSDSRLKKDIAPSKIDAIKILKDLEVVDYSFSKSPGAKHTGYIAQQVETVLPSMVRYNERDKLYAISQSELIPVLHKAIVDQQKQIDAQTKKIEELEALIKSVINK
jgi:hypothetical protein